jgi:hypothetical protein
LYGKYAIGESLISSNLGIQCVREEINYVAMPHQGILAFMFRDEIGEGFQELFQIPVDLIVLGMVHGWAPTDLRVSIDRFDAAGNRFRSIFDR